MPPAPGYAPPVDHQLLQLYAELPQELETDYGRGFTLSTFGPGTFEEVNQTWVDHPSRKCIWNWELWYQDFRRSPSRIEMVVRKDGVLCALLLGKKVLNPGVGDPRIEMCYIEGNPAGHPLQGDTVAFVADVCGAYGRWVGAQELRIVDPIEPLHKHYSDLGFAFVHPKPPQRLYCVRSL